MSVHGDAFERVYKQILQCRRSIVFAAGAGFYAALPAKSLFTLIAEHVVESASLILK
jgi:O-glycosyl hydrolase